MRLRPTLPGFLGNSVPGLVVLALVLALNIARAGQSWEQALAAMPLTDPPLELNRTNCVRTILAAFRPNASVKAVVFMPGATDELYLFRRVRVAVTNSTQSLLDAMVALTNQSFIRASFRAPFLLLHTFEDPLNPDYVIQEPKTAERLKTEIVVAQLCCDDWDWDALQPVLKRSLKIALRPWRYSGDSWHFYRHSFCAWNLNGLEALQLTALAGKSKFTLRRREAVFEVDPRALAPPKLDKNLR